MSGTREGTGLGLVAVEVGRSGQVLEQGVRRGGCVPVDLLLVSLFDAVVGAVIRMIISFVLTVNI